MRYLALALSLTLLAACTGESGTTEGAGKATTSTPAAAKPSAAKQLADTAVEKVLDPNVQGCLSKVKAGQYKDALPLCLNAANVEPDNSEVADALALAKSKAAPEMAAGEKAQEQADALKDAAKGMKLP